MVGVVKSHWGEPAKWHVKFRRVEVEKPGGAGTGGFRIGRKTEEIIRGEGARRRIEQGGRKKRKCVKERQGARGKQGRRGCRIGGERRRGDGAGKDACCEAEGSAVGW